MRFLDTDVQGVALLTGYHLCGEGLSGLLCIWGERHLYPLGGVLLVALPIWGALATSYNSFRIDLQLWAPYLNLQEALA